MEDLPSDFISFLEVSRQGILLWLVGIIMYVLFLLRILIIAIVCNYH